MCGAAELRHGENDDIPHPIAEVVIESSDAVAEIRQAIRKLAARVTLIRVRVPAAHIGEGDLHADVRFHQLCNLHERLPER